jgi:tRNA(fMet)-specific endonuclease VapC
MKFLLDTNVLSEVIRPRPDVAVLDSIRANLPWCAVPSPVWHELQYGCQRLPASKRRSAIEEYLEHGVRSVFPILAYDAAAAAWHASTRARLEPKGISAPYVDGQIAAIAAANGLVLVTANLKDFRYYEDIEVISWHA